MNTGSSSILFPAFQYALLGLLVPGPTHGYELHKQLSDPQGIGLIWHTKLANLYAQLDQLEKKKWVTHNIQISETRPARKIYELTDEGKMQFESWMETPATHPREIRQDFLLRLYFIQIYKPDELVHWMRMQLTHCRSWAQMTREQINEEGDSFNYRNSVLNFRLEQINAIVTWLESEIESNTGTPI